MVTGPGNGNRVQNFKEVKIQLGKQSFRSSFFCRELAPCIIDALSLAENHVDI